MIRLKEAFKRAKELGLVDKKQDFAQEIWPKSPQKSAYMNFLNLASGKTRQVDYNIIIKLCERLQVSPEYLLGVSENPTPDSYKTEVKDKARMLISLINTL